MNACGNTIVISIEEIADTEEFVITVFTEAVGDKIIRSVEKGIKDKNGDIIEFVKV